MQKRSLIYVVAGTLALTACTNTDTPSVKGTVSDAADKTLYLENAVMNNWLIVDSAKLDDNGSFAITFPEAPSEPAIYRLRLDNKYIYFPVDSIETVTITANGKNFDRGYTLAGNIYAQGIATVDSLVAASVAQNGANGAVMDRQLKNALNIMVNSDTTCLVSYYIVGKTVGGNPLYRLDDKSDVRILANAANNYMRLRPNDSRAEQLKRRWLAGRRAVGLVPKHGVEMQAEITGRPSADLVRYDRNGKKYNFDEIVENGNITILNFTRYDNDYSQANTVALREVYDANKGSGLQIFQIAYDPDEIAWKRSAANMPWIAVWNAPTDNVEALYAYNADPINGAPVSFVFNRNGELVERVSNPDQLAAAVAKAR